MSNEGWECYIALLWGTWYSNGAGAQHISSSVALMYFNFDIRLIYLTWGYLFYQEIKVHVTVFNTQHTGCMLQTSIQYKPVGEQRALCIILLLGQWLMII